LLRNRLLAFLMTIILVVLVIVSFLTSGVLRLVSALLLDRSNPWIAIATLFLPLGLDMVILALLFRYVPYRRVSWDAIWPAAMIGGIGWELAKAAFAWYLTNLSNFQFVYGGIATAIVLLFWAYLSASIFLVSAELCAQLDDWLIAYHDTPHESLGEGARTPRLPSEATRSP
jgi:membrane protein